MNKRPFSPILLAFVALFLCTLLPLAAVAQRSNLLKEGIEQYNKENFEEAIVTLTRAREEAPASAEAAFYLGMAYRQLNDIPSAYRQFEAAVGLKPLSDNAILEVIETATLLDRLDVAKKWIAVAEEHRVYPARVAFLKGASLAKEGKHDEAITAYELSRRLDPTYAQSADFQIGICLMNQKKYERARDLFQAAVTRDPLSDLATYARRYQEAAEQWRFIQRPLRVTIGVTGQYDTNYRNLGDPYDHAVFGYNEYLAETDKASFVMQNVVRLDYVPNLPAPFALTAGYAALNTLHQRYGTDNDTFANSFTLAPGMNFEGFAFNLVANYTHTLKRDPGYRRYSEVSSVGPLFRYLLRKDHILEANVSYTRKNFFKPVFIPAQEDQSSRGLESSLGWIWLFRENAFLNLKLGYSVDDAEGIHYDNQGYRASASLIYPLADALRLQIGSELYLQDYRNENLVYRKNRKDRNYTGTIGVTWSAWKYLDATAQYLYQNVYSNIYTYDYRRHMFSLGVELKF